MLYESFCPVLGWAGCSVGFMTAYLVSLSLMPAADLGSLVMGSVRTLSLGTCRGTSKLELLQSGSGAGDVCRVWVQTKRGTGTACELCYCKWVRGLQVGSGGWLTLGLAVVHAILASQRLNQPFQRLISLHVITMPNAALNLR